MNRDKHIWEGWTVGDFIDDVEPIFNMCAPFHDKQSLKLWVAQEQPYYKKHIPEVYNYFLTKIRIMNKEKCKFCGSDELVYHQYVIQDSACQECGEWQNEETI